MRTLNRTSRAIMELTPLFLSFVVSTTWNTFFAVLCDSFTRFDHGVFLDGNVCPEGNATQTTGLSNDLKCLFHCRDHSSCHSVFLVRDEMKCVTCSARFFYQNITTSSSFYKRNDAQSVSYYLLVKTPLTWYKAQKKCEDLGGHLLILNSQEEMDFIYPYLVAAPDVHHIWTGAKGTGGKALTFEWVDGSKVSNGYTNWRGGQPYPNDNNEKYVYMVKDWNYQWNDEFDSGRFSICEFN